MAEHAAAKAAWEATKDEDGAGDEPARPKPVDVLYDAGSTTGLGQLMAESGGVAIWLKHEARKLVRKLMDGTTIGSFDELNQIAEHAYYRNSPVNNSSKWPGCICLPAPQGECAAATARWLRFLVENPHLVCVWLMHMEDRVGPCRFASASVKTLKELVPFLAPKSNKDDEDSVAGLMRFLIAHFPATCNRLLPECGLSGALFLFCVVRLFSQRVLLRALRLTVFVWRPGANFVTQVSQMLRCPWSSLTRTSTISHLTRR